MKKTLFLLAVVAAILTIVFILVYPRLESDELAFQSAYEPVSADAPPPSVFLEELTWVEVRNAIRNGTQTVIIPTGGTEQNGPHMVLGKHNYVVRMTSEIIARELGNTLVAPVMAYVPEGDIGEKSGHMAYAGTISISEQTFKDVLEQSARSLIAHGFTTVLFIGDSYNNQDPQRSVAEKLSLEQAEAGIRVLHIDDYYSDKNGQIAWLAAEGETDTAIGTHAGIRDTSELMVAFEKGIRPELMLNNGGAASDVSGVWGDPSRANLGRGHKLLALKVQAAVSQIKKLLNTPTASPAIPTAS